MAMSWINIESSTKKGDAENYPGGKRTVKYQVMFPDGHSVGKDNLGELKDADAATFHKNCVEEYGETFVGKVLFKQLVVMAQGAPRPMMESGARDETIQAKMRDWKADDVKVRNVKTVQFNAYQDALDRFNAATTFEEMVAARNALQAMVATMRPEVASSTEPSTADLDNGGADSSDEDNDDDDNGTGGLEASGDAPDPTTPDPTTPDPSQTFQRRTGRRQ